MTQPNHIAKTTNAMLILLALSDSPGLTAETLKSRIGNRTQTVAARLCDLMDLGLVVHGKPGHIVRGSHVTAANTFLLSEIGQALVQNTYRDSILSRGFKALGEASDERAKALAELKAFWKKEVATAGHLALVGALGAAKGANLL